MVKDLFSSQLTQFNAKMGHYKNITAKSSNRPYVFVSDLLTNYLWNLFFLFNSTKANKYGIFTYAKPEY